MVKKFFRWVILITLFLSAGCNSLAPVAEPIVASTPIKPGSETLTTAPASTLTATAAATPTPKPTFAAANTITSTATSTPAPAVLIGAGDIAYCGKDNLGDEQTAALLGRLLAKYPQAQIFAVGDTVQGEGLDWEYRDCFGPTWGRFLDRMHPVPGNHEYMTDGGAPYFAYFGARAGVPGEGYYSYDLGAWHIIALNSNCNDIACGPNSAQAAWLRADLAAHPSACTLLYWHYPRWSSGLAGGRAVVAPFWEAAAQSGVEIVISGDDHDYERFAPLDASGKPAAAGIRSFVVGTGGTALRAWGTPAPYSELKNNDTWGVIVFKLYPDRYEWEFVPVDGGKFTDLGSGPCH